MRIISGAWKGRTLSAPIPSNVRPTTDIVRGSIFNTLHSRMDIDEITVLDLCCGVGGLGIEALSRGATHCTFVDKSKQSLASLEQNCRALSIPNQSYTSVYQDAQKFVMSTHVSYSLIFFDPPYALRIHAQLINLLAQKSMLSHDGILVVERSAYDRIDSTSLPYTLLTTKTFGETAIDFLCTPSAE